MQLEGCPVNRLHTAEAVGVPVVVVGVAGTGAVATGAAGAAAGWAC